MKPKFKRKYFHSKRFVKLKKTRVECLNVKDMVDVGLCAQVKAARAPLLFFICRRVCAGTL